MLRFSLHWSQGNCSLIVRKYCTQVKAVWLMFLKGCLWKAATSHGLPLSWNLLGQAISVNLKDVIFISLDQQTTWWALEQSLKPVICNAASLKWKPILALSLLLTPPEERDFTCNLIVKPFLWGSSPLLREPLLFHQIWLYVKWSLAMLSLKHSDLS